MDIPNTIRPSEQAKKSLAKIAGLLEGAQDEDGLSAKITPARVIDAALDYFEFRAENEDDGAEFCMGVVVHVALEAAHVKREKERGEKTEEAKASKEAEAVH